MIFGYTVFNDWSARDPQRREMCVNLGPAKGKDLASTLGTLGCRRRTRHHELPHGGRGIAWNARREGWGEYAGGPSPGLSFTTADWLYRTEIAGNATDTWGFEVRPTSSTSPSNQRGAWRQQERCWSRIERMHHPPKLAISTLVKHPASCGGAPLTMIKEYIENQKRPGP